MVDDIRLGSRFRALRQRLNWRQRELASKAGVSQGLISLIERGRIGAISVSKLQRVATALDAEILVSIRWRGGQLDRLLDEGHARLAAIVLQLLVGEGWDIRPEVSYSIFGERGSIDLLAWHERTGTLLVIELKTELISVEETLRKHDEKERLARAIVRERFGWSPARVARLLVLPSLATARRRVARTGAVMSAAYPMRGAQLRGWLRQPTSAASGLLFIGIGPAASPANSARRRVRKPTADPGARGPRRDARHCAGARN